MTSQTILVPVDFSDLTPKVIAHAERMASAFTARMVLLHVSEPEPEFVGFEAGPTTVRANVAHDFRVDGITLRGGADQPECY